VVFLHLLLLSTAFPVAAWQRRSAEHPLTLTGERLVVFGDGLGYYAWLRSLLIDGDWDFDNEFDEHNPLGNEVNQDRTAIGRRANPYAVGPACLWAPAVALTHMALQLGLTTSWPVDGYSLPYQVAVGISGLLVALGMLLCLYGICRAYGQPTQAAWAVAFLILGTTLLNYSAVEVSMGHGYGAAALALLVWYWLRTYGAARPLRWLGVGALVGLAGLMRWQLAALAVLPAGEFALGVWQAWRRRAPLELPARAAQLALAAIAALIVFLPQMIAWKAVYGSWLVAPMSLNHAWLWPRFIPVLFGTDRSLFYWTPLALLALLGCLLGLRSFRESAAAPTVRREALTLLLIAFFAQVYLLASISGRGVYLGSAFGYRSLTEAVILLAPGLTLLLAAIPARRQRWLLAGLLLLIVWNAILMAQYHFDLLPRAAGAGPATLLGNVPELIRSRPVGCVLFLTGPALLALTVFWEVATGGKECDRAGPVGPGWRSSSLTTATTSCWQ
jgi:hypothetical protein